MPFHQVTLDELGTGFAAAVSLVLVNRLMISVRRHYYGSVRNVSEITMTTLQFEEAQPQSGMTVTTLATGTTTTADPESSVTATHQEEEPEYELQEYSERAGF